MIEYGNFLMSQRSESSTAPLEFSPDEDPSDDDADDGSEDQYDANDDNDDQYDTTNLGDGSQS